MTGAQGDWPWWWEELILRSGTGQGETDASGIVKNSNIVYLAQIIDWISST